MKVIAENVARPEVLRFGVVTVFVGPPSNRVRNEVKRISNGIKTRHLNENTIQRAETITNTGVRANENEPVPSGLCPRYSNLHK